jgi:hypothetical protein
MARGDWFSNLAVGLAAILAALIGGWLYDEAGLLQSVYEQRAAEKTQNYINAASIRANRRCASVPRPEIRLCVQEEYDSARKGEHDEADLQAQLVTSAWTRAMGIAAIIGMSVGILGVGLVFFTFRETRKANQIARDALEGQLRPWVDFEAARNGQIEVVDGNVELTVPVDFTNVGVSPAIDLTYMATMIFGDIINPHFDKLIQNFNTVDIKWADKNLFHGNVWKRRPCAVHTGERSSATRITYIVIARYRTAFSPTLRFTAKAYDISTTGRNKLGEITEGDAMFDLRDRPPGAAYVIVEEREQFAGFTT